jgi:cytochrome c biogenesis protein CcmG/thiol:disulfide interchange protein DsbE
MTEETPAPAPKTGFRPWMAIPALGAAAVLAVFMLGLQRDDVQRLPSTFIDRPVPEFALAPLDEGKDGVSTATMQQPGVKLLNIWASWCGPCRLEHPYLMELEAQGVTIHGFNYKDAPENARAFLSELGDPYELIGTDPRGRAGIEFGVSGVPETFVINGDGVIVYKHVGPIVGDDLEKKILPAIEAARQ